MFAVYTQPLVFLMNILPSPIRADHFP